MAPRTNSSPLAVPGLPWWLALVFDAALVLLFVLLGMDSHHERWGLAAFSLVAWPFIVAMLLAWGVLRAWRNPAAPLKTGVPLALATVVLGLGLRVLTGGGFAWSFAIVTAAVLIAFLVGWRLIAFFVARPARRG